MLNKAEYADKVIWFCLKYCGKRVKD